MTTASDESSFEKSVTAYQQACNSAGFNRKVREQPRRGHRSAGSARTDGETSVCARTAVSGRSLQYSLLYLNLIVPIHAKVTVCTHRIARETGQTFGNTNEKI